MRMPKINLSFSNLRDAEVKGESDFILRSMFGNAAFTDPMPSLADVQSAIVNYGDALTAAASLDINMVALKNQYRQVLESVLFQLGLYVMCVANGDVTILISSGFKLAKTPASNPISAPDSIVLTNGPSSGKLVAVVPTVKGANSYLHCLTAEPITPTSIWVNLVSRSRKCTFDNLQPGVKYWAKTAAVGKGGQMMFSPLASQFAQ